MNLLVITLVAVVIFLIIYFPLVYGKFWHRHDWELSLTRKTPSFYSTKKVNVYTLFKCKRDGCRAFKVLVDTVARAG